MTSLEKLCNIKFEEYSTYNDADRITWRSSWDACSKALSEGVEFDENSWRDIPDLSVAIQHAAREGARLQFEQDRARIGLAEVNAQIKCNEALKKMDTLVCQKEISIRELLEALREIVRTTNRDMHHNVVAREALAKYGGK